MKAMQQAIDAATTPAVQMWMNWMLIIFAASLLFVWKYPPARLALGAFVLSALAGIVIFNLTGEPYLLGISHILFWAPLAYYLYKQVVRNNEFRIRSLYGVWVILLLITIVVSLVFDVRDIALVLLGMK